MNDETSANRARQGRRGLPVLIILIAALILLGIGWVLIEFYGIGLDERQPVETTPSSDIPVDQGGAPGIVEQEATEE